MVPHVGAPEDAHENLQQPVHDNDGVITIPTRRESIITNSSAPNEHFVSAVASSSIDPGHTSVMNSRMVRISVDSKIASSICSTPRPSQEPRSPFPSQPGPFWSVPSDVDRKSINTIGTSVHSDGSQSDSLRSLKMPDKRMAEDLLHTFARFQAAMFSWSRRPLLNGIYT